MVIFWVLLAISLTSYSIVSTLLFFRSQHRYVISRSPTIIQIGHWANLTEIIGCLLVLFYLPQPDSTIWALECLMDTSHCLMVFCYLIRAYRLYFVFNLDLSKDISNSKFSLRKNRVTQRWALQFLMILTFPIISVSLIIFFLMYFTENSFGIITNGERSTVLFMSDTFLAFVLQLMMILMMDRIRMVVNEYQMLKEMFLVTVLLFLTPLSSIFVHVLNKNWLFSTIARNFVLMLISSGFPILMSYKQEESFEIISSDMLGSFELVLQYQISLDAFEKFLKRFNSGEGFVYLELYLSCECCLDLFSTVQAEEIREKLKKSSIEIRDVDLEKQFREDEVRMVLDLMKEVLEEDFFILFRKSQEFEILRGAVYRQEIFSNRLSQTSFLPKVNNQKNTMVSLLNIED